MASQHRWWRRLAFVLLGPLGLLGALALLGPPTWETGTFFVATSACLVGVLRRWWRVARVGAVAMLSLVALRLTFADDTALSSTRDQSTSWLDRIVPERDLALGASRLLVWTGGVQEPGLLPALEDGYDRMRNSQGWVPSPVLSNFLLPQTPSAHQVVRVAGPPRDSAVVFLHGSMGSVTLECWQVAVASGMETVCPSMHWSADWSRLGGREIAADAIAELRARGYERVFLVGLSNGAIGASRIAPSLDVDGVVLISGAARDAPPARVPTLMIQGARDTMTPPSLARSYAHRSRRVRYREAANANHWLILSHHEWWTAELREWLAER